MNIHGNNSNTILKNPSHYIGFELSKKNLGTSPQVNNKFYKALKANIIDNKTVINITLILSFFNKSFSSFSLYSIRPDRIRYNLVP
jgi:hypothetical protein